MRMSYVMSTVVALMASSAIAASTDSKFDSYTKAYQQAEVESRPMLVILNPGEASGDQLDINGMAADVDLAGYVVAEIDTTTPHGQEVHKLFKSPTLPHVVVIDNQQKKQIYKASRSLTADELSDVLARYRSGDTKTVTTLKPVISTATPATTSRIVTSQYSMPRTVYSAPPANCPSCQRNARYRF